MKTDEIWSPVGSGGTRRGAASEGPTGTDADYLAPVEFTEDALATKYGDVYAIDSRYVEQWGKWLIYCGDCWRADQTLQSFSRARGLCRHAAKAMNDFGESRALSAARTAAAVERMARSDRRMAALPSQWDADPWVLNTPGGIVDLRTGRISEHDDLGMHYSTKLAGVIPDQKRSIATWLQFLNRVTKGDNELQSYLQRVAGYTLTGDTREHALFFLYGTGGNGKGVFIRAITGCLGDYRDIHVVIGRPPPDRGGRLARCSPRHKHRDRRRAEVGRVKDQSHDRR
jgi:putative DNA primase/helicase